VFRGAHGAARGRDGIAARTTRTAANAQGGPLVRLVPLRGRGAGALAGALCLTTTTAAAAATGPAASDVTGEEVARPAAAAKPRVVRLRLRTDVLAGRRASVRGVLLPAVGGRQVAVERRDGRGWRTLDRATTAEGGRFVLGWRTGGPRSAKLRLRIPRGDGVAALRRPVGRVNVFRRASVSWYGPGLYGNALGCGGRLSPSTLGVAHKTLPCGTKVTLHHRGRTVRVPVVDRGPYVGGREFDLTAATKERLRFGGVGTVLVSR
jgi:rare lipoprotein A